MGALEIAIAGCGPAGLAAALLLHRDGHRVRLFDQFESPRPIGSGLMIQPTGLAVLREMGLAKVAQSRGVRIDRLFGQAGDPARTVLDVRYDALKSISAFGIGIHRASLFGLLHEQVERAGIPIEAGRTITESELAGSGRRLCFAKGPAAGPFNLIVDALGSRTPLAPPTGRALAYGALWASLDWPDGAGFDGAALEQRYRAASIMAGVLPIGTPPGAVSPKTAFFWSLRADRLAEWRAMGLEAWKADVRALWPETEPFLSQLHDADAMTFAHYRHRTLARPAEQAMFHLGDAWHSASPQLGQGANMAWLDAYALAVALRRCAELSDALEHAVGLRRPHILLYQALSTLFTPVYQSDSKVLPFVRDRLVGPISKLWPATTIQAAMVSGLIGSPLRRLGISGHA